MSLNPNHYWQRGGLVQEYHEGYIKVTPNGDQLIAYTPCGPTSAYDYAYFTTERLFSSRHVWEALVSAHANGYITTLEYGSTSVAEFEVTMDQLLTMRGLYDSDVWYQIQRQNKVEDGFLLDVDRPGTAFDSPGFEGSIATSCVMSVTHGVMSRAETNPNTFQRGSRTVHYRRNKALLYQSPATAAGDCILYQVNGGTGAVTQLTAFNASGRYLIYFFSGMLRKLSDNSLQPIEAPTAVYQDTPNTIVPFLAVATVQSTPVVPLTMTQLQLSMDRVALDVWGGANGDEYQPTYNVPLFAAFLEFDGGGSMIDSDASGNTPQSVACRSNDPKNVYTYLPPFP